MYVPLTRSRPIGIVTGSGPEAGINLWQKVLHTTRRHFGDDFRGDLDTPDLALCSVPTLGLSMELHHHEQQVWNSLADAVSTVTQRAHAYTVACNTLNIFADKLREQFPDQVFISYPECALNFINEHRIGRIALLAAAPVLEMNGWSSFSSMKKSVDFEIPGDIDQCQNIIYSLKKDNPPSRRTLYDVYKMIDRFEADHVLLACTEFSVLDLSGYTGSKRVTDVSQLVADELVNFAFTDTFVDAS